MKTKAGKLTVVVGSMFSGKSTELQRQGRRKEIAGERVLYFKPKKDNRYTPEAISTHDGNDVGAILCEHIDDIFIMSQQLEPSVVCIDEVQFFERDIVSVIEGLLRRGIDVVVSGLDLDRFGEPFGAVPELLCKAEEIIKVRAVCSSCGDDAWVSAGTFVSDEQVVIGEKEKYQPLCRSCYYQKGGVL
ncbi:thymidine kinase [Bacillus phage PK2]|nr:thymidine kinase [Bacillus phage PK2]